MHVAFGEMGIMMSLIGVETGCSLSMSMMKFLKHFLLELSFNLLLFHIEDKVDEANLV